jgi:outer membrane lipoprotein SlyB
LLKGGLRSAHLLSADTHTAEDWRIGVLNSLVGIRVVISAVVLLASLGVLGAQTRVDHGRITAVSLVRQQNTDAQAGGAMLGGMIGLASASGRSGGTAVARGIGGALAGQQIGRVASERQKFQYTILIDDKSTTTVVTDEAGLRVGDCVAVERGRFNNLRLVDDSRCAPPPSATNGGTPAPKGTADDVRQADACIQAKDRLFEANSDEDFERAYRMVRLICSD